MTDDYKPVVDERWRGKDHPYWNARCTCGHPRREHSLMGCWMAGCYCKLFVCIDFDSGSGPVLPNSYA